MINIYQPRNHELAIDVIEREQRKCHCGKRFDRFYIDEPQHGDDRAGIIRVATHCGVGGHNMYSFKVWPKEIESESDEQALTNIIADMTR